MPVKRLERKEVKAMKEEAHKCRLEDIVFSNKIDVDGGECVSVSGTCRVCGRQFEEVYSKNDGLWDPKLEEYVFLS